MYLDEKSFTSPPVESKPSRLGFIAWLETQDPGRSYNFYACGGRCLIGQYMASIGIAWDDYAYMDACEAISGQKWDAGIVLFEPWTCGAALSRARRGVVAP